LASFAVKTFNRKGREGIRKEQEEIRRERF